MIEERLNEKISDIEEAYRKAYALAKENPFDVAIYSTLLSLAHMKNTLHYIKGNHVDEQLAIQSTIKEMVFFTKDLGCE
jgi:hypothetical protein